MRYRIPPEIRGVFGSDPVSVVVRGEYDTHFTEIAEYIARNVSREERIYIYSFRDGEVVKASGDGREDFEPRYIDNFSLHHSVEKLKRLYVYASRIERGGILLIRDIDELVIDYKMRHDEVSVEELVYLLHQDLVRNGGINIFIPTTKGDEEIRIIPDCFLSVSSEKAGGYGIESFTVEHLRKRRVRKKYIIGVSGRKFYFYAPSHRIREGRIRFTISGDIISTGIADLDVYLGGGLSAGSYNIIEITGDVPEEVYQPLIVSTALANVKARRGVVIAPSERFSSEDYYNYLKDYLEEGERRYLKIIKSTPLVEREEHMVDGFSRNPEDRHEVWKTVMQYLNRISTGPVVDITEYGTIEATYSGEDLVNLVNLGINWLSEWGDVGIGILPEESEVKRKLLYLAKTYLRIYELHGVYMIESVKPRKAPRIMVMEDREGITLRLRKVVQ